MKTKSLIKLLLVAGIIVISNITGCKKLDVVTATSKSKNIYSYLSGLPDQFSEFVKMLDKTGYSDFLKAYGAYTCFAPDNNAIKNFYQERGKTSVDDFGDEELKNIIKIHLIQDTIATAGFTDGKLPQVTMLGQYLITGVSNSNGISTYIINRQALVTQGNIILSNGYIHVIDHVLKPATKSVAQTIEDNSNFSIFTQALKETGYYDTLNILNNPDTTRRFLTVISETNKALQDSGITSYAALKLKYSKTGDPKRADDSLHLYVAYHIITDAKYIADIVSAQTQPTLAPLNVLLTKLVGQNVLINDLDFNGVHEQGVMLDRPTSDISAVNGVVHTALAHFTIKNRVPVRVDFDVADQPELRKLTSVFRKVTAVPNSPGGYGPFPLGFFKDITWQPGASQGISYGCTASTNTVFYQWWSDLMIMPMSTTATNVRASWFEFRTPLLVKGKYKVWICYSVKKASNNNPAFPIRVSFDGEPFQRFFNFDVQMPAGTPGELEALGWKSYTTDAPASQIINNPGRLVGIVDVKSTDRHIVRFDFVLSAGGQSNNYLDLIQFIPINDNQLSPRFARDGSIVP